MPKKVEAWFDGACEPTNPGGTASYGAIVHVDGKRVWDCSEEFESPKGNEKKTTNNVAEYGGFLAVIVYLKDNGLDEFDITIYGDSKMVIEQMKGTWKIKGGSYMPLAKRARAKLSQFKKRPTLQWIPREENTLADKLSKSRKRRVVKLSLKHDEDIYHQPKPAKQTKPVKKESWICKHCGAVNDPDDESKTNLEADFFQPSLFDTF